MERSKIGSIVLGGVLGALSYFLAISVIEIAETPLDAIDSLAAIAIALLAYVMYLNTPMGHASRVESSKFILTHVYDIIHHEDFRILANIEEHDRNWVENNVNTVIREYESFLEKIQLIIFLKNKNVITRNDLHIFIPKSKFQLLHNSVTIQGTIRLIQERENDDTLYIDIQKFLVRYR